MKSRDPSSLRTDFDRIALLESDGFDHNSHYHRFLLNHLPLHCEHALEIGCGTGAFSRLLAQRVERVMAVDLSPNMIQVARGRSTDYPNIDYQVADALEIEFPDKQFDCVASIATLHHMPAKPMLMKMRNALKVGGVLLVLDLVQAEGLLDLSANVIALPVHLFWRLAKTGQLRPNPEVRKIWAEHGRNETYLTISQVRQMCREVLPGAQARKHLFWRYSIVWKKENV